MDFLEVSAKTYDDAVTKACEELGVPSYELDIEVISEGSTGFLGIGSKPAVIQVRKKVTEEEAAAAEEAGQAEEAAPKPPKAKKEHKKKAPKEPQQEPEDEPEAEAPAEAHPARREPAPELTDEEVAQIKETADRFLKDVFKAMEMPVEINMSYDAEAGCLNAEFEGEDMGILIGKRGQTLDSLQYLVSLVINRNQKNYIRVKLDTEDYRKRRKETLENLAKNIAGKVKRNRRPVSLEAMNPYERRIIHSALQGNRYVETYSEGNEPYRHVVVAPKKNRE